MSMDRERPIEQVRRDSWRRRRPWIGGGILVLLLLLLLRGWITPSLDRDQIRVAVVERGEVVAAISAAGLIVPADERVVSALFETEVVEVLAGAGTEVEAGAPILRLDARALELERQDLEEQLALKENLRRAERQTLGRTLDDYRSRLELLAIDLESRKARLGRYQTLAQDGAISKDQLFEAELDVTRTSVEISQIERSMQHAEDEASTGLERIGLETSMLRHQLQETQRRLAECTVTAPQSGVVTWALEEVGTRVAPGVPLARVADLSRFQVEAQLSDFYASRITSGLAAAIRVNETPVPGRVQSILPNVEGGQMTLQIAFDEPQPAGLRPRQRVDVDVITGRVEDGLSLKNGPAIAGQSRQSVYRIVDGVAERTEVQFGISSRHRVEVLDGLEEGDEVILSDPRDFEHLQQIRVE